MVLRMEMNSSGRCQQSSFQDSIKVKFQRQLLLFNIVVYNRYFSLSLYAVMSCMLLLDQHWGLVCWEMFCLKLEMQCISRTQHTSQCLVCWRPASCLPSVVSYTQCCTNRNPSRLVPNLFFCLELTSVTRYKMSIKLRCSYV